MIDAAAAKELETQASEGDSEAMYQLGIYYSSEECTAKNVDKAKKYLYDSANLGNVSSMEALADLYVSELAGRSPAAKPDEVSINSVLHYYRKAIVGGSETALKKLADFYYTGDGSSNKHAIILYLQYVERNEDAAEDLVTKFSTMLDFNLIAPEWKCYRDVLEFLSENGHRQARRILRTDDIPEPDDELDFDALLEEKFEVPEITYEEKVRVRRTFGQTIRKRDLQHVLLGMGLEPVKSGNGYKVKMTKMSQEQAEILKKRGYIVKENLASRTYSIKENDKK